MCNETPNRPNAKMKRVYSGVGFQTYWDKLRVVRAREALKPPESTIKILCQRTLCATT